MNFKVAAALLFAANFSFTSVARAQFYQPGLGYGGNAPCGYPQGPAPGATSEEDELAGYLLTKKSLTKEMEDIKKSIERGQDSLKARLKKDRTAIGKYFLPTWATTFTGHMDRQMNCGFCGPSGADRDQGSQQDTTQQQVVQQAPQQAPPPPVYVTPAVPPQYQPTAPPPQARKPLPNNGGSSEKTRQDNFDACMTRENAANGPKWQKWGPKRRAKFCHEHPSDESTMLDKSNGDRMIASVGGGRAPASFTGSRSPANDVGLSQPQVTTNVERRNSDEFTDFDPGRSYFQGEGNPSKCYDREPPYFDPHKQQKSMSWKFACGEDGEINPDVCARQGYTNGHPDYFDCTQALSDYLDAAKALDEAQADLRDKQEALKWNADDIKGWKHDHPNANVPDDATVIANAEARKAYGKQAQASVKSGPSFGQSIASVLLGGAMGYGTYALLNGQDHAEYNRYVDANTALGWQSLPYQTNPASIAAGMGVFGGVTGSLLGSFGCGQTRGGVNPAIFGNPYGGGGSPYASMGGGMYNGAGPWGLSGPWGYNGGGGMPGGYGGLSAGLGFGYPGYGGGGMPGYGGYGGMPGYGGGIGGGIGGMPGYGGYGGMPGYGGGIGGGIGGMPGYGGYGGMPGYGGGIGGGIGGMPGYGGYGGMPGYGAGIGGLGGAGLYQEQMMRSGANANAYGIQGQQLSSLIYGAQNQLGYLGGTFGGGYGGYGSYSGYGGYGGYQTPGLGFSAGFGLGNGYAPFTPTSVPYQIAPYSTPTLLNSTTTFGR